MLDVRVHDLRDWTHDVHRTVDDTPYGGGAGMVMKPEPGARRWTRCSPPARAGRRRRLIVPTPGGRPFTQALRRWSRRRAVAAVRLRALRGHRLAG